MAEQLYKLSPNRDLQCYFLTPSAVAAISEASDSGLTLSGKWRQQFDWAVVEWNRDNVFEHPALRYLPDGDLSALTLTYEEQRSGCIPVESNLYPTVAWNKLRVWADDGSGNETIYYVDIAQYANPSAPAVPASATMTLIASPGSGFRVGLALLENHHYYQVADGDTLETIAEEIATAINGDEQIPGNPDFSAISQGASITVTWKQNPNGLYQQLHGANGNRITVYGFVQPPDTNTPPVQAWAQPTATFSGGQFAGTNGYPGSYQISLDFSNLQGTTDPLADPSSAGRIPTKRVRKLRWTWAADLQSASFEQTEFQVTISNWTVTGNNRQYSVAGPGSRRIEDTDSAITYAGAWSSEIGNYSGSRIQFTTTPNDTCTILWSETAPHYLFLGTRLLDPGATVNVSVDGQAPQPFNLELSGEDVLVRLPLGLISAGAHQITLTHTANSGSKLYLDFLEIVYPSTDLPDFEPNTELALATDWDTYHSQSLPAERTAWLINKLGFHGRVNHYTGALWFYELVRTGTQYASLTVTLTATEYDGTNSPTVILDLAASASSPITQISHLVLLDDTTENVVEALAALINIGTNLLWASANGNELTLTARAMGTAGNGIVVQLDPASEAYALSGGTILSGGIDGAPYNLDAGDPLYSKLTGATDSWRTDLNATPRLNRAARDWHLAFYKALQSSGLDLVTSFSTELMNGDPSADVGIAQRYPDGSPVVVNTPAVQTNFSPTSLAFWKQTYIDMAGLQSQAGFTPYLQFGEVQWWYSPKAGVGMTFYDDYTKQQFETTYGVEMQTILDNTADPSQYPNETAFLPTLIGAYTSAIRGAVRAQFPNCRFEVLYPTDTNNTQLNQLVNYPNEDWTPINLDCLKTESFTFTGNHDLDLSSYSMNVSAAKGFPNSQRSHLVGISDAWTAWMKETDLAQSQGLESIVLFALDQYCLIGYPAPPFVKLMRSQRQG